MSEKENRKRKAKVTLVDRLIAARNELNILKGVADDARRKLDIVSYDPAEIAEAREAWEAANHEYQVARERVLGMEERLTEKERWTYLGVFSPLEQAERMERWKKADEERRRRPPPESKPKPHWRTDPYSHTDDEVRSTMGASFWCG